eukprot:350672_1
MNWFPWLFILIHVFLVNGEEFFKGTGKLIRMATKERLNRESMMLLRQKQMMMMYKYQGLSGLKLPVEQLKRLNNFNKWQIENLKKQNNEFKDEIVHLQGEVQQIKYDTEGIKQRTAIKKWQKKEAEKGQKA